MGDNNNFLNDKISGTGIYKTELNSFLIVMNLVILVNEAHADVFVQLKEDASLIVANLASRNVHFIYFYHHYPSQRRGTQSFY